MLAVAAYARAEAEAKPGFVYTVGHHAPLVYNHLPLAYHHPVVYTAPVGCQNNDGAAVPCAHGVLPYGLVPAVAPAAAAEEEAVESVEKREAEPTAEVRLLATREFFRFKSNTEINYNLIIFVVCSVYVVDNNKLYHLDMDSISECL